MATNFPNSLDSLNNPATTDQLNSPSHAAQHANANDAIEQLEAKVGANGSAVTTSHDYKIAQLEAAVTAGSAGTKLIYQDVRNQSGVSLAKGAPVRVTGSDGASGKLLISAASNATEEGSSKTFGLVSSTIANNSNGQVVTNGLLEGVDTTGAVDGDPVWLGVNGAKIFGLANKPVAPAHLVYLGVVVRGGQQNTGSIFVSIQNGFEIEELHNVLITSLANKDALVYDSTTQLWKNYDLSNDFVLAGDLQNSLGDYIPLNALGQPSGAASLDADGNLIVPENKIIIEGATADAHELILQAPDVTSDITVTLPNASGTLALTTQLFSGSYTDLTNKPTIPSLTGYATENYVSTSISNLIDAAPTTLDTLNELAAALGDDPNYAATITTALGNKLDSNYVTIGNTLLDGISGQTYGLIGTSAYLDVKNTNGYNKEIELDIVSVEAKLVTDGFAKLASPTFTGTVGGITKSMVGLANVDNTTDALKPISTATQTALDLKAALASPTFTGTPSAPTATAGTNTTQLATTAFVKTEITSSVQPGAVYQTSAPSSPAIGQIWIDSDQDVTTFDSNIIRRKSITATAGQTVFTTDLPFIDGFEQVFFNGLLLLKTSDYTTSGGNTVTLTSAAAVSDIVEIVSVTGANSVTTYTQAEVDALLAANTSVAPISISASTNLAAKKRYFVTSASALTLTLPSTPALNDEVQIVDASGNSLTYNITVDRNGKLINGNAGNLIIDVNGGWYTLVFTGNTYGWKVA